MNINKVHIIGIGGCASSAVAEFLSNNKVEVSGSDMVEKKELIELISKGVKINFTHDSKNIYMNGRPDIVLYSPAIPALNPNNPELVEAENAGIKMESWEEFIGDYLAKSDKLGITVSGSEGKGTTAGILTCILKDTEYDPLSILGAKLKNLREGINSNIYIGQGKSYILEGDEYNRNFLSYHPDINVMINFDYEHPETYKDFKEYSDAFAEFFSGMSGKKKLIFHATEKTVKFASDYKLENITWFGHEGEINKYSLTGEIFVIRNHDVSKTGNSFYLEKQTDIAGSKDNFYMIPALPGYMALNASGAIIAALEIGLSKESIRDGLTRFKGMVRRFDLYRAADNGVVITDYGHSPGAVGFIREEIKRLFPDRKIHIIFQPHLFSRTFNFFGEFVKELSAYDKISVVDIFPAREDIAKWSAKVSSDQLVREIKSINSNTEAVGKPSSIYDSVINRISEDEITCFVGAGDMDLYYGRILDSLSAESWF